MRPDSIRARMTLVFALSIAFLMGCACGGLLWYARHSAVRNADMLLNTVANEELEERITAETRHTLPEWRTEAREELKARNVALLIVDARGRVVEQTQKAVPVWPRVRGDGWRVVVRHYRGRTLVFGLPWQATENALRSQAEMLDGLYLFVVAVASGGAWLLVGRTLSPIGALARQAQAASTANLRVHLALPSHDAEIVELVTTLNGLLARLAETAAAKGRFHAAASHELRTPLQALSGHLELALQRPRTEEEYRAVIREAHQQTQRLISLVRSLLLLSQLDANALSPKEPVLLADVCERALCHFASLRAARHLHLEQEWATDGVIYAAPMHADILVRNLIENAVKYATEGGCVRVRLTASCGEVCLEIGNTCPALPAWNAERLFEPFYRPDASRNSQAGGAGLGLAICKAIADAYGWSLSLHQEAGGIVSRVRFAGGIETSAT